MNIGARHALSSAVAFVAAAWLLSAHAFGPPGDHPGGAVTEGTVAETMNAGGYTYVLLETESGQLWAAGPSTPVAVGDRVAFGASTTMTEFHSPSLDRTFPSIEFASRLKVVSGSGAEADANTLADAHGSVAVADPGIEPVAKVEGGWTVAEVHAGKADLAGKPVTVRGKVVKYNGGILGRNWLHIQDGSGEPGTHDLTVTTDGSAEVGDVVVITGTVVLDRDFGMGYRYDLIVEEATVDAD